MVKKKYVFKILVAGQGGVGKTTLLNRAVTGKFVQNTAMTIGVEFHLLNFTLGNEGSDDSLNTTLQLWDFGGQERFRFMLDSYVAGARGALLLYDLTRLRTLDGLEEWVNIVRKHDKNLPILFVGTKLDRVEDITVADDYAHEFLEPLQMFGHMKISSKDGTGVKDAFKAISRKILEMNGVPLPAEDLSGVVTPAPGTNLPGGDQITPSTPSPAPFSAPSPPKSENPAPFSAPKPVEPTPAPFSAPSTPSPAPFSAPVVPKSEGSAPFSAPSTPSPAPFSAPSAPKSESPAPFSAPKPVEPTPAPFSAPSTPSPAPFSAPSAPKSESPAPFSAPKPVEPTPAPSIPSPAPFSAPSAPKPENSAPFSAPKPVEPTPFTAPKPADPSPFSFSQPTEEEKKKEAERKKKEEDERLNSFFSV
ncbi:hypothetical protein NEF87_003621 [Candidatus Lokiarchaeum ossiferum]|uniref:GTP-binding protein n=1 Tax=Candidatus Lokiarchaeum ossiferum TaxID=2951803 RepID=A0ABY6HUZ5_9ARCH|nr:hypothetical protein NEF87_003621 [Candidatus Lokiarchaeum sp. B-35]